MFMRTYLWVAHPQYMLTHSLYNMGLYFLSFNAECALSMDQSSIQRSAGQRMLLDEGTDKNIFKMKHAQAQDTQCTSLQVCMHHTVLQVCMHVCTALPLKQKGVIQSLNTTPDIVASWQG